MESVKITFTVKSKKSLQIFKNGRLKICKRVIFVSNYYEIAYKCKKIH